MADENAELVEKFGVKQAPTLVLPDGTKFAGAGAIKGFLATDSKSNHSAAQSAPDGLTDHLPARVHCPSVLRASAMMSAILASRTCHWQGNALQVGTTWYTISSSSAGARRG